MASNEQYEERIKQLEKELSDERDKNARAEEKIKKLQNANVTLQLQTEEEEELITNKLMKKLKQLKDEKETILQQVEQEEELLTNTLQQKLVRLRDEKIAIENQLEVDKEYITNKLHKQMDVLIQEKNTLEKNIEQERTEVLNHLTSALKTIRETFKAGDATEKDLIECLKDQVESLSNVQQQYGQEKERYRDRNTELQLELNRLQGDNFVLEQKIKREHEKQLEITKDIGKNEFDMEMEDERHFNHSKSPQNQMRKLSLSGSNMDRSRSASLPLGLVPEQVQVDNISPRRSPRTIPHAHAHIHAHHHVTSLPVHLDGHSNNPLLSTSPTKMTPQVCTKDRRPSLIQSLRSPRSRSNSSGSVSSDNEEDGKK
ncbi:hypothetical protein AKO1_014814 [Acrasis kona]|uniref:Uncharacterized protein n=1 Tax=Acrasis kona TaxID=1008807 RepID=A0AAW2Z2J8_9EUKA